ncbi:hypothetical protein N431DRAFT_547461 [Stipitochalara longipes BDJ]|nr:hypothetical protein N431DRAFT_547461 [Stipitochalara longipes BDJ]
MAGDFTMAGLAMMRVQRSNTIGNIDFNSSQVNYRQLRPAAEGIAQVTLSDTQKALQRVLASPHQMKLLALKGYYIDENQVIRKDSNFNIAPMAPKYEGLSPGPETVFSPSIDHPCTLSSTAATFIAYPCGTLPSPAVTGVVSACDTPTTSEQQLYTAEHVNMALCTLDSSDPNAASIYLNKELPPKPILCISEYPERRGVFDAFDSGSEKVKCPVLLPTPPETASPSSPGSNETDFELSPSLRTVVYSPELLVGRAVKIHNLNDMAEQFTSLRNSDSAESGKVTSPPKVAQPLKQARRLPTTGQIAAVRTCSTGSPVYRVMPKSKFNTSRGGLYTPSHESLKRIQKVKASAKQEMKAVDDVFHTDSATGSNIDSPQGFDDITRRYTNYGIGPTVKYARDAHQIIMGDRYPHLDSKFETHLETTTHPPRVSSLAVTDIDVTSRLARPTKASAARAEANSKAQMGKSTTMTSVKKLGSRLSSIFPGRGRSGTLVSHGKSKSVGAVDEKHTAINNIASPEAIVIDRKYQSASNGHPRRVTIENNRINVVSSSGAIGNINDENLIGEPSDKVALQESQHEKEERRAAAAYASGTRMRGNTSRTHGTVNQRGRDQDDEEPPTPRATGTGLQGHYAGGEQLDEHPGQELHDLLEMMRTSIAGTSGLAGVQASIDLLQANGQHLISLLASAARKVEDREGRDRLVNIIQAIGEGLVAASFHMAATVALADFNQRLLTTTVSLAEYANFISNRVVAMNTAQR